MLLTLTTTHRPATDLGFLLHKHPERVQAFNLPFGTAHVFYPEANEERCTAALLLEIDPVKLTRRRKGEVAGFALQPYVNDRPYVASSFLSVALAKVFGSALAGSGGERQALADTAIPLQARLMSVPCRPGEAFLRGLFEPLGYELETERYALDPTFPEWGESRYYSLTLRHTVKLRELLRHLYVLIPVLDDEKHYWVGEAEVEKLLAKGEGWLAEHPEKETIARRYLKHKRSLTRSALDRLAEVGEAESGESEKAEEKVEEKIGLHKQRLETVHVLLKENGAKRVLDLGCGEGKLLRLLLKDKRFTEVVGMDVSHRALVKAAHRLKLERLPERARERIRLLHGSLLYRDERLTGFDAAALVEVIEHLDPFRLAALERNLFGYAAPQTVIVTTPNREYNVMWESLSAGTFRHGDHRFEWTRSEFSAWAQRVAETYGYKVETEGVGPEAEGVGAPSQLALFRRTT